MHILTNVHRGMYGKGYGLDPLHFGYKTEESLLNDKFSDLYLFKYTYILNDWNEDQKIFNHQNFVKYKTEESFQQNISFIEILNNFFPSDLTSDRKYCNQFKVLSFFYLTKKNHTYVSDFNVNKMASFLHFTFFSSCSAQLIIKTDATKNYLRGQNRFYRLNGAGLAGYIFLPPRTTNSFIAEHLTCNSRNL